MCFDYVLLRFYNSIKYNGDVSSKRCTKRTPFGWSRRAENTVCVWRAPMLQRRVLQDGHTAINQSWKKRVVYEGKFMDRNSICKGCTHDIYEVNYDFKCSFWERIGDINFVFLCRGTIYKNLICTITLKLRNFAKHDGLFDQPHTTEWTGNAVSFVSDEDFNPFNLYRSPVTYSRCTQNTLMLQ